MTISEILAEVDEVKPNQFDDGLKIKWLSTIEAQIINDVINTHEKTEEEKKISKEAEGILNLENLEDFNELDEIENEEFSGYTEADLSAILVVPDAYAELYKYYLYAMIDFATGETERYTNSMMMFNSSYQNFSNWYNRTHKAKAIPLKIF